METLYNGWTVFGTTLLGVIIWALRLEGRVNEQDIKHASLKELIETKFDNMDDRLERIERALNGALKRRE